MARAENNKLDQNSENFGIVTSALGLGECGPSTIVAVHCSGRVFYILCSRTPFFVSLFSFPFFFSFSETIIEKKEKDNHWHVLSYGTPKLQVLTAHIASWGLYKNVLYTSTVVFL